MAADVPALPDDPATLKAMLLAERARSERLAQIIKELQRHRFGRRAESLPEDQLLLALEEVEQALSEAEAITDAEVGSNGAAKKDTKASEKSKRDQQHDEVSDADAAQITGVQTPGDDTKVFE